MAREKRIRLKLDTPNNVRKSISKVANMVANGEMTPQQANAIVVGCNAILGCIRTDEQEKKIKELQDLLDDLQEDRRR